jgi:NADH-quinone oxidoreductase subunit E
VLAGFPDDRADEGPAAGPASLLGLQIARENDWAAPESEQAQRSEKKAAAKNSADASKRSAAEQADTSRAQSETTVEQSGAETRGEDAGGKKEGS